jgi:penicillin-binding protein 2
MLGGVAVLLFTVLFFRLWVLQVLSGETFEAQANENRARTVIVHAPRGEILDRKGRSLVVNRPGNAVTVDLAAMPELALACGGGTPAPIGAFAPAKRPSVVNLDRRQAKRRLDRWRAANRRGRAAHKADVLRRRRAWAACVTPGAPAEAYDLTARQSQAADEDRRVLRRLAKLTATPPYVFGLAIRRAYTRSPFEPVTLLDGVPHELIVFLKEHGTRYPGIRIRTRTVRQYPHRTLAAHLWGQLTEIDAERLKDGSASPTRSLAISSATAAWRRPTTAGSGATTAGWRSGSTPAATPRAPRRSRRRPCPGTTCA